MNQPAFPLAVMADICSERVRLACSAAKAIPGDVWGMGAEGHYAFLCGLAALLGNRSDELESMIAHEMVKMMAFEQRHKTEMSLRCPERILCDLGFLQAPESPQP